MGSALGVSVCLCVVSSALRISAGRFRQTGVCDDRSSGFDPNPRYLDQCRGGVVGWYRAANGDVHGFFRGPDGDYKTIDVPGSIVTEALGINDWGEIVGAYRSTDHVRHGYRLSRGQFTSLDPLGSTDTFAWGVNDRGDIVGFINVAADGYLLDRAGTATQLDVSFPNVVDTQAYSINTWGQIAGSFDDAVTSHGFVRSRSGEYTQIDVPFSGNQRMQLFGMNDRGDLVGCWADSSSNVHAFVRSRGSFESFDDPDAQQLYTVAYGINVEGDIVGEFYNASDHKVHGFICRNSDEQHERNDSRE
jgi:uncharacterized membrane protein